MSSTAPLAASGLSDRFALIVDGLCRAAAARLARNRAAGPLLLLLWSRLHGMAARFASLAARASAGTLPPPRATRVQPARMPQPRPRLPEGFAWLFRLVPEAASYGSQLQHLLSGPEMAALLEAAPQAGRILRPLCRMLAVPHVALLPSAAKPPSPSEAAGQIPAEASPDRPPNLPPDVPANAGGSFRPLPHALSLKPPLAAHSPSVVMPGLDPGICPGKVPRQMAGSSPATTNNRHRRP